MAAKGAKKRKAGKEHSCFCAFCAFCGQFLLRGLRELRVNSGLPQLSTNAWTTPDQARARLRRL